LITVKYKKIFGHLQSQLDYLGWKINKGMVPGSILSIQILDIQKWINLEKNEVKTRRIEIEFR